MRSSEALVFLQRGFVVPARAYHLAIRCEARGIRLSVGPGDKLVADSMDGSPIPVEVLEQLRGLKLHLLAILRYTPDDRHLFDSSLPYPHHGPLSARARL